MAGGREEEEGGQKSRAGMGERDSEEEEEREEEKVEEGIGPGGQRGSSRTCRS